METYPKAPTLLNHSHTLKLKNSEVIIIKAAKILAYMSLNSS